MYHFDGFRRPFSAEQYKCAIVTIDSYDLFYFWWFYGYLHAKLITSLRLAHKQWKTGSVPKSLHRRKYVIQTCAELWSPPLKIDESVYKIMSINYSWRVWRGWGDCTFVHFVKLGIPSDYHGHIREFKKSTTAAATERPKQKV